MKSVNILLTVLFLGLWAAVSGNAEETAANAADSAETPESQNAARLAQIKINAAARRNAVRRNTGLRITPQKAGGLNADKLNALLANAATYNRRMRNSPYLNQVQATGVAGNRSLRAFNSPETNRQLLLQQRRANSPLLPRRPAEIRHPANPAVSNRRYDFKSNGSRPAGNPVNEATIQKAVEAALAKRDAESLSGKVKKWFKQVLPLAGQAVMAAQ